LAAIVDGQGGMLEVDEQGVEARVFGELHNCWGCHEADSESLLLDQDILLVWKWASVDSLRGIALARRTGEEQCWSKLAF
jgi:hypothetical protein